MCRQEIYTFYAPNRRGMLLLLCLSPYYACVFVASLFHKICSHLNSVSIRRIRMLKLLLFLIYCLLEVDFLFDF